MARKTDKRQNPDARSLRRRGGSLVHSAKRKALHEPTLQWFEGYEVRVGGDGKVGIYTKDFNCRLATFNANTACLHTRLKLLFERANAPRFEPREARLGADSLLPPAKRKRKKRAAPKFKRTGNDQRDFGFAGDVGDQGWGKK